MSNIIRSKKALPIKEDSLQKVEFGAKTAIAALTAKKTESKIHPKQHHHSKSISEQREETTRRIQAAAGTITGVQARSNKQLTSGKIINSSAPLGIEDAWDDPNEVSRKDDLETALEKRLAKLQLEDSQIISRIEDPGHETANFEEIDGLNAISESLRAYSHFNVISQSPELVIVLAGLSDAIDDFASRNNINIKNPTQLDTNQILEIFSILNKKKHKILCDNDEEAELILAGAVAILAIPRILELIQNLGLNANKFRSLEGRLVALLEKVSTENSEYYNLYLRVREETEYSVVPPDEE